MKEGARPHAAHGSRFELAGIPSPSISVDVDIPFHSLTAAADGESQWEERWGKIHLYNYASERSEELCCGGLSDGHEVVSDKSYPYAHIFTLSNLRDLL